MQKIKVNKDKCIGCATCTFIAPKTFKMGKDGKAEVIDKSTDSDKVIKEAINSCPVKAISLKG